MCTCSSRSTLPPRPSRRRTSALGGCISGRRRSRLSYPASTPDAAKYQWRSVWALGRAHQRSTAESLALSASTLMSQKCDGSCDSCNLSAGTMSVPKLGILPYNRPRTTQAGWSYRSRPRATTLRMQRQLPALHQPPALLPIDPSWTSRILCGVCERDGSAICRISRCTGGG